MEPCDSSMVIALAGASGLVGRSCLELLLAPGVAGHVLSLGRRALAVETPNLTQLSVDFAALPPADRPVDAAFCALGTTRAKAGSDEAFRRVDLEYVAAFATWARAAGARTFILVSSVGANATSSNLYLCTKGQAEIAVQACGFASVTILRPSFLVGPRGESRPVERAGIAVASLLGPIFLGPLAKYRPIAAREVAAAMVRGATAPPAGVRVLHYSEILALAGGAVA